VRLDGTDNGRYMAVNSEQPLSVKMSCLDNSNDRHSMPLLQKPVLFTAICAVIEKFPVAKRTLRFCG